MGIKAKLEEDCKRIEAINYAMRILDVMHKIDKESLIRDFKKAQINSFTDSNGTVWRIDRDNIIKRTPLESVKKQKSARKRKQ